MQMRPDLVFSVSGTTRPPRPGEVDGRDYRFVSPATFDELVEDGAFLEWAEVFGHRYGTLIAPIADALEAGQSVVLEIDVQGARSVRARFPDAVLIFIVPPSASNFLQQLEERLRRRGSESEAEIARRLAAARKEMEEASWFDHVVVNDRVERAAAEVAAIIDEKGGASSRPSR
jgi:guanylate kinase